MRAKWLSAGLATFMVVGALTAAPGSAAGGAVACPAALPTNQAVDGLMGTGYTVERGTTPAPFTATVLGRITDGIAPGVDMIMAELDSPAIQRAGVWSGMSGSPVYTKDGKLIGAVAYGLSLAPSPIAGITPASQMKALLDLGTSKGLAPEAAAAAVSPEHVTISPDAAKRVAATQEATLAQASGGFTRLKVPVSVSGLSGVSSSHGQEQLDRLASKMPNARIYAGGKAASRGSSASEIVAGGNYAAALSYGDVTLSGVGTTTFVCSGKAVAFGHPFLYSGPTSMSLHPAKAVYVQVDKTQGSFKVANPGSPVGTVNQDRLAGIRGQLGTLPTTATIRSELTVVGGGSRVGTTQLVYQPFAPTVSAFHAMTNVDLLLDSVGDGSAAVTLRVEGVRPNGQKFTYSRSDKYADRYDISGALADSVYEQVSAIVDQQFEKVRITSVTLTGTVNPTFQAYKVSSLKVKQGGSYVVPNNSIQAKAGSTLPIRLSLVPLGGGTARNVDLALPVPAGTAGSIGSITVNAGRQSWYGDVFVDVDSANSFPEVLSALQAAPKADSATAMLNIFGDPSGPPLTSSVTASADRVIQDYMTGFSVNVN